PISASTCARQARKWAICPGVKVNWIVSAIGFLIGSNLESRRPRSGRIPDPCDRRRRKRDSRSVGNATPDVAIVGHNGSVKQANALNRIGLSKSRLLSSLQCRKRLWLEV